MKIGDTIWLPAIEGKCIFKHNVRRVEVDEMFCNNPKYRFVEKGSRNGEDLYAAYGQSDAGRYLIAYFVYKGAGRALIISARDMNAGERKIYEEK